MDEKELAEIEAVFEGEFEMDDVFKRVPALVAEVRRLRAVLEDIWQTHILYTENHVNVSSHSYHLANKAGKALKGGE